MPKEGEVADTPPVGVLLLEDGCEAVVSCSAFQTSDETVSSDKCVKCSLGANTVVQSVFSTHLFGSQSEIVTKQGEDVEGFR